jgi:polyphenol oxidase
MWRYSRGFFRDRDFEDRAAATAAFTSAALGDTREPEALGRVLARLNLEPARWAAGEQVHGGRVREARAPTAPRRFPATDGLAASVPGLALCVRTADCVPAFVVDPAARAAAVVHAGRRGVRAGILTRAIALLRRRGARPSRMLVALGPHIQPCCYEVGPEVARRFRGGPGVVRRRGKLFLDLTAALRDEARRAGVSAGRFSASPHCTGHDLRFFSHRRQKTEKRHAAVLALR